MWTDRRHNFATLYHRGLDRRDSMRARCVAERSGQGTPVKLEHVRLKNLVSSAFSINFIPCLVYSASPMDNSSLWKISHRQGWYRYCLCCRRAISWLRTTDRTISLPTLTSSSWTCACVSWLIDSLFRRTITSPACRPAVWARPPIVTLSNEQTSLMIMIKWEKKNILF